MGRVVLLTLLFLCLIERTEAQGGAVRFGDEMLEPREGVGVLMVRFRESLSGDDVCGALLDSGVIAELADVPTPVGPAAIVGTTALTVAFSAHCKNATD